MKKIIVIDNSGNKLDPKQYCINKKQKTFTCNVPNITVIAMKIESWTFNIATFTNLIINNHNKVHCEHHNNIRCNDDNEIFCTYDCIIQCSAKNIISSGATLTLNCKSGNEISTLHDGNIRCFSENKINCGIGTVINCKWDNIIDCANECTINGMYNNMVCGGDFCNIIETEHVEGGRSRLTVGKYGTLKTRDSNNVIPEIYNGGKCTLMYEKDSKTKVKIIKGKG